MTQRRALWLSAGALLAFILGVQALRAISNARCFSLVGDAVCRVETARPLVALTFDDGPTAQGVDSVLPLLARYRAKGTFFLIGALANRPLVRRIVADGHEVGNHSFRHERMILRTSSFYDEEIRKTDAALVAAGAPRPVLFRPPHGKKLLGLPLAIERSGKRMIMWNVGDWPDPDPRVFARHVVREVQPGSIVLIHPMDDANATERAAMPLILDGLAKRGFQMVTVSELLAAAER